MASDKRQGDALERIAAALEYFVAAHKATAPQPNPAPAQEEPPAPTENPSPVETPAPGETPAPVAEQQSEGGQE